MIRRKKISQKIKRKSYPLIRIQKEFLVLIIIIIVLLVNRVVTMWLDNLQNTPMNKL